MGVRFGSPVVTLVQNGIAAGAVVTESGESGICGVRGHSPWLRQSLAAQTQAYTEQSWSPDECLNKLNWGR